MGMPSLLRSLHQTLSNRKPATPSCCVLQPQTLSFRFTYDVYTRFNSGNLHRNDDEETSCSDDNDRKDNTERQKLLDLFPLGCQLPCSSSFDSPGDPSSSGTDSWPDSALPDELLVGGGLSSRRFFFCPSTTNSILEERKKNRLGGRDIAAAAAGLIQDFKRGELNQCFDSCESCEESVAIQIMNSDDPYLDFLSSMEEMIEAHCLREWPQLQALLQSYLQLNDGRETHRIIVRAFIDLIMKVLDDRKD